MNQQNEAQQAQMDQQPDRSAQKALSRRKFLTQASLASLPVLMSLKSGDAWGCVPLNCTGGEGNWSGTASAVSSVKERATGDGTITPIFDSVATIIKVVKADIGIYAASTNGYYGYLWDHVRTLRCKKENGSYIEVFKLYKTTMDLLTAADLVSWAAKCQTLSSSRTLYKDTSGNKFTISSSTPLRKPIVYQNVVICANTKMSQFFPRMTVNRTLWQCLNSTSNTGQAIFEKYVTAAFVGSLWQQDEIWNTPYASGVKSQHKPNCYPEINVLRQAYKNVIANAPARKITEAEAAADMGRMFKAYTKL